MKAFGPKIIRPRTPPEQKLDALEKKYKGITEGVEALKKLMKDKKRIGLTGNWVLDFVGIYDWRNSSKIKNVGRDFIRWAIPAHVEVEIVDNYRRTLLKESQAAQYLRFIAVETLSPYVKPVNRINSTVS
jgi:DNA polymerase elongation subunit (family B)